MGVKCQPYVAHSVLQQPGFSGANREAVGDRIRIPAIRFTPCGLLAVGREGGYLMKRMLVLMAGIGVLLATGVVNADCRCVCMNGSVQAVCSSTLDVEPVCSPRVCPITSPSVEPIQRPRVPPVGTTNCVQRQVYNEYTRQYEWKEVCY